jgi:hypothetical protein
MWSMWVCDTTLKNTQNLKNVTVFSTASAFLPQLFINLMMLYKWNFEASTVNMSTCNSIKARTWGHKGKTTLWWLNDRNWVCCKECALTFFEWFNVMLTSTRVLIRYKFSRQTVVQTYHMPFCFLSLLQAYSVLVIESSKFLRD